MPQRSHSCSESTRTFHLQVYIFNASKPCQHSTSAKSACEQCQHSPKFRASSAPIQGIIRANSVSLHFFFRGIITTARLISEVPLQQKQQSLHQGRSQRSPSCPSQRQIRALRVIPAALLSNQARSDF